MSYEIKAKPSGILYVEFEDLTGKRRRPSLKTRDMAVAKAKARSVYAEALLPKEDASPTAKRTDGYTVDMAIRYAERTVWSDAVVKTASARRSLRSDIRQITKGFGPELVKDIDTERLQRYVEACRKRGLSDGTIDKHFGRLSKLLTLCATEIKDPSTGRFVIGYVPKMPKLSSEVRRDIIVTPDQEEQLLEACAKVGKAKKKAADYWLLARLIIWQVETGFRLHEAMVMHEDWFDADDAVIIPKEVTKTQEERAVVLSDRAVEVAKELRAMDPAMFAAALTRGRVQDMWTQVRRECDLMDIHLHDLRHTAITRWRDNGIPLDTCARMAGHKDARMTYQVYDKANVPRLRKEMREAKGQVLQFPDRKTA